MGCHGNYAILNNQTWISFLGQCSLSINLFFLFVRIFRMYNVYGPNKQFGIKMKSPLGWKIQCDIGAGIIDY